MYERLKRIYPNTSDEFIRNAVNHIENSEVLRKNPEKAEKITDCELKMYYEEIIYNLGGTNYGKNRNIRSKEMQ